MSRYEGTYAQRGGDKVDGCATLWRKDAFRVVACETIHFSEHALRDNVALIVVLEARPQQPADGSNGSEASKPRRLIVGNVHILFNPKRGTTLVPCCSLLLPQYTLCLNVASCAGAPMRSSISKLCRMILFLCRRHQAGAGPSAGHEARPAFGAIRLGNHHVRRLQ